MNLMILNLKSNFEYWYYFE